MRDTVGKGDEVHVEQVMVIDSSSGEAFHFNITAVDLHNKVNSVIEAVWGYAETEPVESPRSPTRTDSSGTVESGPSRVDYCIYIFFLTCSV